MTTAEAVKDIADGTGHTQEATKAIIEDFVGLITDELVAGRPFVWPKLGKFSVATRSAREARNPHTGEAVAVAEKKVAKFKPAAVLARKVNGEE